MYNRSDSAKTITVRYPDGKTETFHTRYDDNEEAISKIHSVSYVVNDNGVLESRHRTIEDKPDNMSTVDYLKLKVSKGQEVITYHEISARRKEP